MTQTKGNELALIEPSDYPVLFDPENSLAEILAENFGGADGLGPGDLDRIIVPSGGGKAFEVPSLEGGEMVTELDGIILSWSGTRKFWEVSLDESEGNTPPDCASDGGEFGVGMFGPGSEDNPSGKCDSCPKNVWGSGSKDPADTRGPKACREGRLVYFLRPGSILPVVIQLPPTSIKPLKNYMLRLTNSQRPYWSVVTRLALEQHTDKGVKWSTIVPTVVSMLDADQFPAVKAFSASVKSIASQQRGPAPAPAAAPETSDSSG